MANLNVFALAATLLTLSLTPSESESSIKQPHPHFQNTHISSLLDHPSVTEIMKDQRGRLWIGTQEGLFLYNGRDIVKYGSAEPEKFRISDSHITSIAETHLGKIYITVYSGDLFVADGTMALPEFSKQHLTQAGSSLKIRDIYNSKAGHTWLTTKTGLYALDSGTGRLIVPAQGSTHSPLISEPNTVYEMPGHGTLVGSSDGLLLIDSSMKRVVNIGAALQKILIPTRKITALSGDSNNNIFVGFSTGEILTASISDDLSVSRFTLNNLSDGEINEISYNEKKLVIGTDDGLYSVAHPLDNFASRKIASRDHTGIIVDSVEPDNGFFWIGSLSGIYTVKFTDFHSFPDFANNQSIVVSAFEETVDHNLLIGTHSGLFKMVSSNSSALQFPHGTYELIASGPVSSIYSQDNSVWIGFLGEGLQRINLRDKHYENYPIENLEGVTITSLAGSIDGKQIWVGTYGSGLARVGINSVESLFITDSLDHQNINLVQRGKYSNQLYAVALHDIYLVHEDGPTFKPIKINFDAESPNIIIYSLAESKDGSLWIGTKSHGIFKLSLDFKGEKELFPIKSFAALKDLTIYKILIDSQDRLWCSTNNGIVLIDEETDSIHWYDVADGLQGDDFTVNAGLSDSNGVFHFGGAKGFNSFSPKSFPKEPTSNTVAIIGLEKPTSGPEFLDPHIENIVFSHHDKQIRIFFSSLNFYNPSRNKYRYILDSLDTQWQYAGSESYATYSNVPPGEYYFHVQTTDSTGYWQKDSTSLQLTILPPPWKTWWAYTLYLIATAIGLWIIHRVYHSFVVDRKAAELAYEMYLAEERANDDLQEQLDLQQGVIESANTHSKSTIALVSDIQRFTPHSPRRQEFRVQVLSDLEECLYYLAGEPVVDVYRLTELVFDRVRVETPEESKHIISINEVTRDMVDSDLAAKAALIIAELVLNATLHAFDGDSPAQFIHVKFSRSALGDEHGDYWTLRVSDNGSGFLTDTTPDPTAYSGLGLVAYLTEQLGGTLKCHNEEGATVSIQIPGAYSA